MTKTGENRECPVCNKLFHVPQWKIDRGVGIRCSSTCYGQTKKGKTSWNKGLKNKCFANSGSFASTPWKFSDGPKKYKSIHHKIGLILGKTNKCEKCGNTFEGKKIHWANVSGNYLLKKDDWIRLCSKCHYHFDNVESRRSKWAN